MLLYVGSVEAFKELMQRFKRFDSLPDEETSKEVHKQIRRARTSLLEFFLLDAVILSESDNSQAVLLIKGQTQAMAQLKPPITADEVNRIVRHASTDVLAGRTPV